MMMTTLNNRVSALFADPLRNVLRDLDREFGWNGESNGTIAQKLAAMSVWEDDSSYYIEVDVPGMSIGDLDVTIEKGKLKICGARRPAERSGGACHEERYFGQFERQVALAEWVDPNSIDASLNNGVLQIKFAKRPEQQRQTICIKAGSPPVKGIEAD